MSLGSKIAIMFVSFFLAISLLVESAEEGSHHVNIIIATFLTFALGLLVGDAMIREKKRMGKALVDLVWVLFGGVSAMGAFLMLVFGLEATLAGKVFLGLCLVLAVSFRLSKSVHDVLDERKPVNKAEVSVGGNSTV